MKNYRSYCIVLFAMILFGIACKDDDSGSQSAELKVPSEIVFVGNVKDSVIEITSNLPWTISGPVNHQITISPRNGNPGTTQVKITMYDNLSYEDEIRLEFTVQSGDETKPLVCVKPPRARLSFPEKSYADIPREGTRIRVGLNCNTEYDVAVLDEFKEWISCVGTEPVTSGDETVDENILLDIASNPSDTPRRGRVVVYSEATNVSDTLTVWQDGATSIDGYVSTWQTATRGAGVNIVIMGDGFTRADMLNGFYENAMKEAAGYLFAIEPYKSYRDYFNVYFVWAVSNERGIEGDRSKDTKFQSLGLDPNIDICWEYIRKAPINNNTAETAALVVLNATWYGGRCSFWSDGASIARAPMSQEAYPYDFRGLVQHELGGHGIGKLHDEYPITDYLTPQVIEDVRWWQSIGFYSNIDFTNDPKQVLWKHFLNLPRYSMVGIYEGCFWQKGSYRAEQDQCMIYNIPYYNAPSREAIVKRIKSVARETYSFEEFMANDRIEPVANSAAAYSPLSSIVPPPGPGQLEPEGIREPSPLSQGKQ